MLRISCSDNFLCGEFPVRRISCAENFLCGEFPVRRISCAENFPCFLCGDFPVRTISCADFLLFIIYYLLLRYSVLSGGANLSGRL